MDTEFNLEKNNDWAKIASGGHLHISLAASGLRGYYCIGCSKQMVAVKPHKNIHHKPYYRHHATDVGKDIVECTFSSTDYRERLAGNMFARLKEINLPPVYKYPPSDMEGMPNLLAEGTRLHATSVGLNVSFYENEHGAVRWGKEVPDEGSYFLYKPNVVFFYEGKPTLLLEFVTAHKITDEKQGMLKKLGVNTVQIIVPRDSEEEIEKKLKVANKVKWIYNENESNTDYIPVQSGNSERIPDIDQEQRRLFEESLACRASQISNLVRSIRRSVGSQPYRSAKRNFDLEIERVESLREGIRARLDEMESSYEGEAYAEIEPEEIEIEKRFIELSQKEDAMERYYSSLEKRYLNKRQELDDKIERISTIIREQLDQGGGGESLASIYEARHAGLQRDTERVRDNIGRVNEEEEAFREDIGRLEDEERRRFERDKRIESTNFERIALAIEEARNRLESEISSVGEVEAKQEGGIDAEFESLRDAAIERIGKRNVSGDSELSGRIAAILGIGGLLSNYDERESAYKRYKTYLELVRGGAYEAW